jgi:hypothetical protein
MLTTILLEPEQKGLLIALVETARSVPKDKRQKFRFDEDSAGKSCIMHWGLRAWTLDCYKGDVEVLINRGLLNASYNIDGLAAFDINPEGFEYYRLLKTELAEPISRIEESIRSHLFSFDFQTKYPEAYQKWNQAQELLWTTETQQQLTAIGHHCREAVQEFVTKLVERHQLKNADSDKARHILRLKAVITELKPQLGDSVFSFLEALISSWSCLNNLIQRQEHGGQKEGKEIIWNDARRIVFQSAVLMEELDQTLTLQGSTRATA